MGLALMEEVEVDLPSTATEALGGLLGWQEPHLLLPIMELVEVEAMVEPPTLMEELGSKAMSWWNGLRHRWESPRASFSLIMGHGPGPPMSLWSGSPWDQQGVVGALAT